VTIRLVIADDQALVRSGLAMILETDPEMEVVGEAHDGTSAIAAVERLRPDVALLDIRMPGTDGLAAAGAIAANPKTSACRVVMLTTYDLDEYLFEALHAGAAGFLLKGVSPEDLIRGIHQVASGECLLAPSATRRLIAEFVDSRRTDRSPEPARRLLGGLTPRELDVLTLMARGHSNSEIATDLFVGENTVKTHVGHILTKLGARDRVQAVIIAYQAGLPGVRPTPDGVDATN
jgi:DNA-binding NarL/FixJ family response regulator